MTSVTAVASKVVEQLDHVHELRPFPAVAARLVAACRDPSTSSRDVVEIVQCDPAMASRLLSVANSSMYGYSGRIRTVQHAVVVLGFRAVAHLALSVAARAVFGGGEAAKRERARLWNHSLAVASLARLLAPAVPEVLPDEAFLAGVFHDVGKLVFYDLVPEQYAEFSERHWSAEVVRPEEVVRHERSVFGVAHTELGRRCGEGWGLTAEINTVAAGHHGSEDGRPDTLARLTELADQLAHAWGVGGEPKGTTEGRAAELANALGLDDSTLESVREKAPEAFDEVRQLCSL